MRLYIGGILAAEIKNEQFLLCISHLIVGNLTTIFQQRKLSSGITESHGKGVYFLTLSIN